MKNKKPYRFPELGFEIWPENVRDAGVISNPEVDEFMPGWREPVKKEFNFLISLRELGVFNVEDGGYTVSLPTPKGGDPDRAYRTTIRTNEISTMGAKGGKITFFLRPFRNI